MKSAGKNIVFLNLPIEFYSPKTGGAISTIIAEVTRSAEARGHKVTVLTRVDQTSSHPWGQVVKLGPCGREDLNFFRRRFSSLRARFNRWDWPFFDYYRAAVSRAITALETTPDILIVFNDLLSPVFLKSRLPQTTICVWLQNEQRTRCENLSAAMSATSYWLTCSEYIRGWTLAQHRFDPARVRTVPSGVNLAQFSPRSGADTAAREVRVLFVGRIDPNKGPDLALRAVATLQKEGLPVSITVAGAPWFYQRPGEDEDPYMLGLRKQMAETKADYLGHVPRDQIASVFREHDVVCVLSRSNEPFGLVTLEAMASGCAVIASNRGGLPESGAEAAILVDPDDQTAVTDAMRTLVTRPAALAAAKSLSLARAARASWDNCVDQLEVIIDETGKVADVAGNSAAQG